MVFVEFVHFLCFVCGDCCALNKNAYWIVRQRACRHGNETKKDTKRENYRNDLAEQRIKSENKEIEKSTKQMKLNWIFKQRKWNETKNIYKDYNRTRNGTVCRQRTNDGHNVIAVFLFSYLFIHLHHKFNCHSNWGYFAFGQAKKRKVKHTTSTAGQQVLCPTSSQRCTHSGNGE